MRSTTSAALRRRKRTPQHSESIATQPTRQK
jgi:hypothetical protein